jgi:hypothetical protein
MTIRSTEILPLTLTLPVSPFAHGDGAASTVVRRAAEAVPVPGIKLDMLTEGNRGGGQCQCCYDGRALVSSPEKPRILPLSPLFKPVTKGKMPGPSSQKLSDRDEQGRRHVPERWRN